MVKAVFSRSGSFEAALDLDKLTELPRRNFRKLVRLAVDARWENEADLLYLSAYLDGLRRHSKDAWEQASQEYAAGWKLVPNKRSRDVKSLETLYNNRRLKADVLRTKKAHEAAVGLKTIFDEECY
jgi:hypothetical protein